MNLPAALILLAAASSSAGPAQPAARVPVLLELFTSEGCSSCPPADALLEKLLREQPVPGAELLALSEHVDYWNSLGWRDPFSSSDFTERQSRYAQQLQSHNYTPQLVVDGKVDVVGSDRQGALTAIAASLADRKGLLTLERRPAAQGEASLHLEARGLSLAGSAQVLLAVVEDGLVSKVLHGENEGRTLPHASVVRALKTVGRLEAAEWKGDASFPLDASWKREQLRAVVFVQEQKSGRVLAAGTIGLAER